MIAGTGVDLAEVARLRTALERHGERFTGRIFTPGEVAYSSSKANAFERYAARFAAKEAAMKALGTGFGKGVRWQDFEVWNHSDGKPELRLHGEAARIAAGMGIQRVHLSLSHTATHALAFVILEA